MRIVVLGLIVGLTGCITHASNIKEYNKEGKLVSEIKTIDPNLLRNSDMALIRGEEASLSVKPISVDCPKIDKNGNTVVEPIVVYQVKAKGEHIYLTRDKELSANLAELGKAGLEWYFMANVLTGAKDGASILWDWLGSKSKE